MCLLYSNMPTRWTEFVKDWASKKGLTYGCALSKPECSADYKKKYPKPPTKKQQKEQAKKDAFREAVERGEMEDEDINRARKKPKKEAKEAFKMTSEDISSKQLNKEWNKQAKENIKMSIEDINVAEKPKPKKKKPLLIIEEDDEPTPVVETKKKGRKPKYATEEERKQAKREQTLASNKRMADMRKELLKQAREQLAMGKEDKQGKGILKDIRKGLKSVSRKTKNTFQDIGKATKLGVNQAVGFVEKTAKKVGEVAEDVAEDVADYGKAVLFGRNDYPPKVRDILKKYGEEIVIGYKIKRTPVSKLLTSALSAVSLGTFGKRFGRSEYDELFHLFLEMTTDSGKRISVEKNEVINMEVSPKSRPKEEVKDIINNIPPDLTINTIMENTKNYMGTKDFFGYSARDNNCQDFIVALLKSNDIGDAEDIAFVKQNTKELFRNLPFLRKFSNTITDLGARVNVITTGAGIDEDKDYIVQSVVFSKDKWTTPKAKKWLKENGYKAPKVDTKENTIRFRQIEPTEAEQEGFTEYRTKDLSDSGIQLILSYKKKVLSNNIGKMPRFAKGSEEAKEWGRMMREKRMKGKGSCGGAIHPPMTSVEASKPQYKTAVMEGGRVYCPHCETSMVGGKINIGRAFKKLGSDIKKGFNKTIAKPFERDVIKPSEKALVPLANKAGDYITAKKGGLATDLIKYGIPAVSSATLGGLASLATGGNPVAGVAASAIGSKLGAMGAKELQKATGTGMRKGRFVKGSQEAKDYMRMLREKRMK